MEMEFTERYFAMQAELWRGKASLAQKQRRSGHASYANRQVAMWEHFRLDAAERFGNVRKYTDTNFD